MRAHTPGPWTVKIGEELGYLGSILSRFVEGVTSEQGWIVRFDDDCGTDQGANARLIAAAPELLSVLLALRIGEGCWCQMAINNPMIKTHSKTCEEAKAAIAKAGGQEV
jgi:hypothetical protein